VKNITNSDQGSKQKINFLSPCGIPASLSQQAGKPEISLDYLIVDFILKT
jgi:hypothetical protein